MVNNYFAIERTNQCIDHLCIKRDDGTIAFEDIMNMSYNEIKEYKEIDVFVTGIMDASNEYFNENDEQTIVTLIGNDDIFIWSILIEPSENEDQLNYAFIDWQKDGQSYRYEKNN